MNERELRFFTTTERQLPDCTMLPATYLFKSLFIKMRRQLWKRYGNSGSRMVWTVSTVSDAHGPDASVRDYLERKTIRSVLTELTQRHKITRACEIGCGYGRVIMVLKEFAEAVKGFEREPHLVEVARSLLPDIQVERVESLARIEDASPYDLVMTCTVLQHLTDVDALELCGIMKRLAPSGHVLCIEKTAAISTTANQDDGRRFISRARSVSDYRAFMEPYVLVSVQDRVIEPTYFNPQPGKVMVFTSPLLLKG